MGDVFGTAGPRPSLQAGEAEGVVDGLPLIEPRGAHQPQPGMPPTPAPAEANGRLAGSRAAAAVHDQEGTPGSMRLSPETLQLRDDALGLVDMQDVRPHPSDVGVPPQELPGPVLGLCRGDSRPAQVMTVRSFGGMTAAKVATTLGVSVTTVERGRRPASIWLAGPLRGRDR